MTMDRKKRGGDVKKAPPGFYTARQAQNKLGITASTFHYYVKLGRIKKHVPPLKREGYYKIEEIDLLATELALFFHTTGEEEPTTETRVAIPDDAQGIVNVLEVRGWKTASAQQRISWYAVNPYIDFVASREGTIYGYVNAVPYKPEAMQGMMSGKKRSWHIKPTDIYPYEAGKSYDLYVGVATMTDAEQHTQRYGFRLLAGFMHFLEELAQQGVKVRKLYAVSAELDGQKLCRGLGFTQEPAQEGDLFPRFVLDMELSNSQFAQRYREALAKATK